MGITVLGTEDFEVAGIVHRRFDTQDVSRFVVGFDGVFLDAVLDSHSFGTILEVAGDFSLEVAVDLAAEKAQDVCTGKSAHAMQDHGGIDGGQIRSFPKHHIGSPFILIDRPIVGDSKSTEHLAVKRIQLAHDSLKCFGPGDA